jgi:hypothetical protein
MRSPFAIALFSFALVGCANAQTPDEAASVSTAPSDTTPVVIADGTALGEYVDLSAWTSPAMPQAVAAARAAWQAQDPDYEEEVMVMAVAEGAFSEPGASQQAVLYLMSLWPRCCPKMGIAVIEDGALVRTSRSRPAQALAIPDRTATAATSSPNWSFGRQRELDQRDARLARGPRSRLGRD